MKYLPWIPSIHLCPTGVHCPYSVTKIKKKIKTDVPTINARIGRLNEYPIIKPISDKDIKTSLDTAIKLLNKTNGKFRFQYGKDFYYIPFSEIMYFCSDKRKIIIQTLKSELCFYGKLCDIKDSLPTYFIPIHQSYIVNQNFIIHYTYDLITLANDEMLSISRRYQKEVRTKLINEDMN